MILNLASLRGCKIVHASQATVYITTTSRERTSSVPMPVNRNV